MRQRPRSAPGSSRRCPDGPGRRAHSRRVQCCTQDFGERRAQGDGGAVDFGRRGAAAQLRREDDAGRVTEASHRPGSLRVSPDHHRPARLGQPPGRQQRCCGHCRHRQPQHRPRAEGVADQSAHGGTRERGELAGAANAGIDPGQQRRRHRCLPPRAVVHVVHGVAGVTDDLLRDQPARGGPASAFGQRREGRARVRNAAQAAAPGSRQAPRRRRRTRRSCRAGRSANRDRG